MFGIGFFEMVVIGGLVLVAVGPDRLPAMLKQLSKLYRQFRRAADDVRASTGIDQLLKDDELQELVALRKQKIDLMGGGKSLPAGKPGVPGAALKPGAPVPGKPSAGLVKPAAPPGTVPASAPGVAPGRAGIVRGLNEPQREDESPRMGVDLVEARRNEPPPPTRPAEDEIIKAKIAAAAAAGMPVPAGIPVSPAGTPSTPSTEA